MAELTETSDHSELNDSGTAVEFMGGKTVENNVSVPLYVSGCLGTLAAVAAVIQNVGPDLIGVATGLIALLGYTVSYAYRKTGLSPRLLNFVIGCIVALLIAAIVTGRISVAAVEPTTQFQGDLQLALALQWIAVLYTWTLTDDRKVVTAAILAISTIGLVAASDVTPALVAYFLAYVAATVFLLIHQNYLLHWHWGQPNLRRSGRRLLAVQLALAAVCWLVTVLAGMVLVVPLQAVGSHLSLSSALRGLVLAAGTSTDTPQPASTVSVSDTKTFSIGQGGSASVFSLSKQVIFQVYPSDGNPHYWRGDTYDVYNGLGWSSTLSQPQTTLVLSNFDDHRMAIYPVPPAFGDVPDSITSEPKASLKTRFVLTSGYTDTLYVPSRTYAVSIMGLYRLRAQASPDGHIQLPEAMTRIYYETASQPDDIPLSQLRKLPANVEVSGDLRKLYIDQLAASAPQSDQQRLAAQARRIVDALPANQQDEYDRAEAIRGWVSDRASYSLDVAPVPTGQDAVSYFLYSSRIGYCDLYASSMAILCRYAGIPARVATGFAPGVGRKDGGYDLRAIDKHAWCQVYFPRYGWVDFDPTGGTRSAPKQTPWSKLLSSMKTAWFAVTHLYRHGGPIPLILTIAILGGLTYISATEGYSRLRARKRMKLGKADARLDADRLGRDAVIARANAERRWQTARQELRRWNLRQKPSETAREFAARAANAAEMLSRHSRETSAMVSEKPGTAAASRTIDPKESSSVQAPGADTVTLALNQLADSYTQARYAAHDKRLMESLMDLDASGEGERELSEVRRFVAWSRPLAGVLSKSPDAQG